MSASLIRRGLELLNEDIKDASKVKKKKKKQQQQQTPSSATVMELVSTKRQGVTKQVKRLQGRLGPGRNKATVKDKRIKSAVEEFRKKQRKSQMSANLKYFMEAGVKTRDSDTMKILSHNSGRQSRNRPEPPPKKAKETESLFTEAEFKQFQKEYFGRTVEEKK
ncbi:active regulator of SIRT1-like [Sebastes umbrosus]|uniref:active regulator of SIRT1-like n=1 Tax=Sebastes umbrosus TaxID=72105 RepID=UPI0018A00D9C|nr:active regulator of SIRT1-like [Sebastes umbrosus]XP_037619663.1 active regulator of SIRT1-like [Sebastes umbrosus]